MIFRTVQYKTLDSTNNLAKTLAEKGASEGTVIVADYQTKGRGQFSRTWQSARGKDLLFSLILRPGRAKTAALPILTQLAAQAIRNYLSTTVGLDAKIKKPNDVLVGGKKIAGILTESSSRGQAVEFVVLGIGLNVNSTEKELLDTATSIRNELKCTVPKKQALQAILTEFDTIYENTSEFARH